MNKFKCLGISNKNDLDVIKGKTYKLFSYRHDENYDFFKDDAKDNRKWHIEDFIVIKEKISNILYGD